MVQPQIDGLELLGLIGEGSCGSVFIARDEQGSPPTLPDTKWYAVRVFNALAVNRPLIESMAKRLSSSGANNYPYGVVPITWKASKQGSRCMIMPLLGTADEKKGTIEPRSLQEKIAGFPDENAWDLIEKIAQALAAMHHCHVPHGNLKPGNILFDDQGDLFLTDFAMGHMPGVGMLPYTDALLYAPPEQLREPEGYTSGRGYRWDTYAFGVLAFRILTGKFPRCEATFSKVAPGPGEHHVTGIQADVIKLAEQLEHRELANWPEEAEDKRERKRREVIQRCLALDPEDRYADLNEVILAWQSIDADAKVASEKAGLRKKAALSKLGMIGSLTLATTGAIGCITLAGLLTTEKSGRKNDITQLNEKITALKAERDAAKSAKVTADTARDTAKKREAKLRHQLMALGITNDHLLAWMMRDHSADLPELKKSGTARDTMVRELHHFLKLTEGDNQFQPIRARITMQLAELEVHGKNPSAADNLLDRAITAWEQTGLKEDHDKSPSFSYPFSYRVARARLACLLQSLDNNDINLSERILPKARKEINLITGAEPSELRRINAAMQIIDGYRVQTENPVKALEHFQLALKDLEGVHMALPDHVVVRSDLARYALHSASLAENLNRIDDAARLRHQAATQLRWLLKKNPELSLAKIRLAEIEIMAAESDMRAGNDAAGTAKLTTAEKLLKGLSTNDTTPDGAAMQVATAKGLRSVLLRDRGRTTDAAKNLDEAIKLAERIVAASPNEQEPLYRLAVFHWQRAGLAGDTGDTTGELNQGTQAANLMQQLLKKGAGKRATELRRSLAYLYGDLGHTAYTKGKKSDAIGFFKNASEMWQNLIDKNGKRDEYTEGLKWSRSRYHEIGGQ